MDQNTDDRRAEKQRAERKLEALLLERLQNGKAILHTEAEFEKITIRVKERIQANKAS